MLFGYPKAATAENWIHESLVFSIELVHQQVDAQQALPQWPEIIPEKYRDTLKGRWGLRDRIEAYSAALSTLSDAERADVLQALYAQNNIDSLLQCESDCLCATDLPGPIQESVRSLFDFAYNLLDEFGVRQRQYSKIYGALRNRVCPFCGCEFFDAPGGPQEDLDHYLARSKYPFAAANLKNLAPMGHKCNSKYKLAKDILRGENGQRRKAFYPYATNLKLDLNLINSKINESLDGPFVEKWSIDFNPIIEEIETWDSVMLIKERYSRDVLDDVNFKNWIWDFRNWCKERPLMAADGLVEAIKSYERIIAGSGFNDRAFLKAAVFRFLLARIEAGCARVIALLNDAAGIDNVTV